MVSAFTFKVANRRRNFHNSGSLGIDTAGMIVFDNTNCPPIGGGNTQVCGQCCLQFVTEDMGIEPPINAT